MLDELSYIKRTKKILSKKDIISDKNKLNYVALTTKDVKSGNTHSNINNNEFHLILINANNIGNHKPLKSNYILNNYNYDEAINYDERSFCRIFFIYLISKDKILNVIFFNPPLELRPLRICVLMFDFACDFALNALFYLSGNISDKYHYSGPNKLLFTLINNLTISLSSTIMSFILLYIFQTLIKSSNKIENLFRKQEIKLKADKKYKVNEENKIIIKNKIKKILKCLKAKIICFLTLEPIFIIFFFYYTTSFCEVYQSTQMSWLLDCLSSYTISLIIALGISFFSALAYKLAIKYKQKYIYTIAKLIYSL